MPLSCTAGLVSFCCSKSFFPTPLNIPFLKKNASTLTVLAVTKGVTSPMASATSKETTETSVQLYNRSLFDKELRGSWKSLTDILFLPLLYTTILFWACLCLYWGSTVSNDLSRIKVSVVNLDDGDFGRDLVQSIASFSGRLNNTLTWDFNHNVVSESQSTELLLQERAWAVVQGTESVACAGFTGSPAMLTFHSQSKLIQCTSASPPFKTTCRVQPLVCSNDLLHKRSQSDNYELQSHSFHSCGLEPLLGSDQRRICHQIPDRGFRRQPEYHSSSFRLSSMCLLAVCSGSGRLKTLQCHASNRLNDGWHDICKSKIPFQSTG